MAETFIRSAGTPQNQDRCTVVIMAHYQEWEPNNTTSIRIAYNRLLAPERLPHQTTIRVNPGTRVPVPMGDAEPGKCELALAHEVPKMHSGSEVLEKAQNENSIRIFDSDGTQIGIIYPNRGCLMHFSDQIYVESTHATALLKVTAFPA